MTRDQTIACTAHAHKLSQEMDFEFESTSKILFDVETNHTAEIYPILSGLKEYGYIDMTRDQNGHDHHFWLATTRERGHERWNEGRYPRRQKDLMAGPCHVGTATV